MSADLMYATHNPTYPHGNPSDRCHFVQVRSDLKAKYNPQRLHTHEIHVVHLLHVYIYGSMDCTGIRYILSFALQYYYLLYTNRCFHINAHHSEYHWIAFIFPWSPCCHYSFILMLYFHGTMKCWQWLRWMAWSKISSCSNNNGLTYHFWTIIRLSCTLYQITAITWTNNYNTRCSPDT